MTIDRLYLTLMLVVLLGLWAALLAGCAVQYGSFRVEPCPRCSFEVKALGSELSFGLYEQTPTTTVKVPATLSVGAETPVTVEGAVETPLLPPIAPEDADEPIEPATPAEPF